MWSVELILDRGGRNERGVEVCGVWGYHIEGNFHWN